MLMSISIHSAASMQGIAAIGSSFPWQANTINRNIDERESSQLLLQSLQLRHDGFQPSLE